MQKTKPSKNNLAKTKIKSLDELQTNSSIIVLSVKEQSHCYPSPLRPYN